MSNFITTIISSVLYEPLSSMQKPNGNRQIIAYNL